MTLRVESIKVSYNLAKSGGHRHSGARDKMFLVCHVILQDQVIKELHKVMVKSPSR